MPCLEYQNDTIECEYLRPDYEKSEEELVRDVVEFLYPCDFDQPVPEKVRELLAQLEALNDVALETLSKFPGKYDRPRREVTRIQLGGKEEVVKLLQRNGSTSTYDMVKAAYRLNDTAFDGILSLLI